jgi:hypothetical protein
MEKIMSEFIENEMVDEIGCDELPEDAGMEAAFEDRYEDGLSDVEADAMTLASAGFGCDEDYGDYGQNDCEW